MFRVSPKVANEVLEVVVIAVYGRRVKDWYRESNNIAYANISVLQNSPNGPVTFNITAYDRAGNNLT